MGTVAGTSTRAAPRRRIKDGDCDHRPESPRHHHRHVARLPNLARRDRRAAADLASRHRPVDARRLRRVGPAMTRRRSGNDSAVLDDLLNALTRIFLRVEIIQSMKKRRDRPCP